MPVHVSTGTLSYSFLDLHTPSFSSREQESCAAPRPIAAVRCRDLAPLREFVPHDWRALPTSPDRWLTADKQRRPRRSSRDIASHSG